MQTYFLDTTIQHDNIYTKNVHKRRKLSNEFQEQTIIVHFRKKWNFFFGRLFGIGCFVVNKM